MASTDSSRRVEEVEALRAIYGDSVLPDCDVDVFRIVIAANEATEPRVLLSVHLPEHYPSSAQPTFEISSPHMNAEQKETITRRLEEIHAENIGDPILFLWVDCIQSVLSQPPMELSDVSAGHSEGTNADSKEDTVDLPDFFSGESLTDRKSHFQAHLVSVNSPTEVPLLMNKLRENGKIARATHNIFAFRIVDDQKSPPVWFQDCEDDGESHAGSRLLHLLELVDARNVLVVVSRWYGGVHLGPDRFKHICNVARLLLVSQGFVRTSQTPSKKSKKKS